ncbi:type IV pilin protein [Pseudomonas sp. MLB6B]
MQRGLSLLELLIVLALTGMLAAIAYPSYQASLRNAARSEVVALLHDAALRLERHYAITGRYADTEQRQVALPDGTLYYRLSAQRHATGFTLLVVRRPQAMMANDACGDFQLDHTGGRTNPGGERNGQACWGS